MPDPLAPPELPKPKWRKYSFWNSLYYCFFSRDYYQEVGEKWSGTGYGYLFLLMVFISFLLAADLQIEAAVSLPAFLRTVPDIKLEKGKFSVKGHQPFLFKREKVLLAVDTTGKINNLDQVPGSKDAQVTLLVTRTSWGYRQMRYGEANDLTDSLAKLPNFLITQENWNRWYDLAFPWLGLGYFALLVVFWFLFEVLALLIYGLVGMAFSQARGQKLGYKTLLRLAVASHAPGLLLFTLWSFIDIHFFWSPTAFTGRGVCFIGLAGYYLFLAVKWQKGGQIPPLPSQTKPGGV